MHAAICKTERKEELIEFKYTLASI